MPDPATDPALQPLDPEPWGEIEWNDLVMNISQYNVVPVVGPELLTIQVGDQEVPLYQHVAQKLAESYGLQPPTSPATALHEVACQYKRKHRATPANLLSKLCGIMTVLNPKPSPVLRKLAKIRGFNIFISTTPDRILETAISEARFRGVDRIASPQHSLLQTEDLPHSEEELKDLSNLSPPVVYHPFGRLSSLPNSCVLTEEDLLEFFYHFQGAEKQLGKLLEVLRNRQLLFLGATWPDWFARFFLRHARKERFTKKELTDYLVGDRFAGESALVGFLQEFSSATRLPARDPAKFVDRLYAEWIKVHPPESQKEERVPLRAKIGQRSLFVSYAREDEAAVERLCASMDAAGLEVWFDRKQIMAGDDWADKIRENVEACLFFLPVISSNTEKRVHNCYFREEWRQATAMMRRSGRTDVFVLPVKLDAGPHKDVPLEFGEKHWEILPGGAVTKEFVDHLKTLVEQRSR